MLIKGVELTREVMKS